MYEPVTPDGADHWPVAAGRIASHTDPLEQPDLVNRLVPEHLARDTVETMMPLRRAPAPGAAGGATA
ncbi:hypothetical protein [Streptomyces fungicidicus]|uniref:hypothetical protein n=1 Tax=Streptomyces fungicidicus TaxID=68203 RepID=UPI0036A8AE7A